MSAEAFFVRLHQTFAHQVEHLNALDAAIGDGDHGSTMLRGLTAAVAADKGRRAKSFMRASGGASGTLFGLILVGIEIHLEQFPSQRTYQNTDQSADKSADKSTDNNHAHRDDLAERLAKAQERICDLGDVKPGDKSMVDALAPAVAELKANGINSAIIAAATGRDATVDMVARRGRAQYVEDGGKGHVDPGAVSVVIFLEELAQVSAA